MRKAAFVCALAASGAASAFAAAPAAAPPASIEPPPGWTDVTAKANIPGLVLALRGPESSSFVVARMPPSAGESAAATRAYLARVLDGMRAGSRLAYVSTGRLETRAFRNGVTAHFMRADLDGRPRLIVAAVDAGGPPLLGTLTSGAPEAMMLPLFGALKMGAAAGVQESGVARSLDEQLQVALGGGLRARTLTGTEREQGLVLAIQGAGSEVVFVKLSEDDASPKDQAAISRATVADAVRAPLESVSPARAAPTPAGPVGVYAWAKLPGSPDLRYAAGFLPWAYWGYSLLARGPQADEILVGALAALKQGPGAAPGLVARTPKLDLPDDGGRRRRLTAAAAAAAAALALAAFAWSRSRKNANLPS